MSHAAIIASSTTRKRSVAIRRPIEAGFSLIELMVAMVLGLLVAAGIVTLFGATSKTNKVQDALARLQENGRYAVTRMDNDMRQLAGQYCDNTQSKNWKQSQDQSNGPIYGDVSIAINAGGWSFPDSGGTPIPPPSYPIGRIYPLSAGTFVQGYDCRVSGGCSPSVPSPSGRDGLPATGASAGDRVIGADVLTLRYQSGTGWPYKVGVSGGVSVLTLFPEKLSGKLVDDDVSPGNPFAFQTGDLALVTTCGGGEVFQAAVSGAGTILSPVGGSLLDASQFPPTKSTGTFDARVFNFSRGFLTVTYYVGLARDPNPDQPGRLIPVLYRKVNGGTPAEIVRGVERLDFLYGTQYNDGTLHYLTAEQVVAASSSNCLTVPPNQPAWSSCLWSSVQSIEVHMLLDTVNNIDLSPADMAYCYSFNLDGSRQDCSIATNKVVPPANPAADTFAGNGSLKAGRMMRHEFISSIAVRNGNH